MQPKMLKTMSRIKRVCAMLMVPRLFRGAGCTPGKFYRLKFDVIRKVKKSTSSDHTDHTKHEEFKCKKCKKIIEYAFGPAEPYRYVDNRTHKDIAHVSMCAKTQGPEDERLTHEKDEKIIAEWLKLNVPPTKENATLLEDLKSKSLSDAKANVLLRVRNLDTILAAVEKKGKEISTNTAEAKDVSLLLKANAGEEKEEIKLHDTTPKTTERLEHTVSLTEDKALKLHATTADKQNEEKIKLAPKLETISEVPLVEAAPKTDIFNPPKDSVLNVTRFDKSVWQDNQSQFIDKIAQKYMQSPVKDIDRHLVKEISRLDLPHSQKIINMSAQEEKKLEPEVVKNVSLDTKLNTPNTSKLKNESFDNSEHISSALKTEPIRPAEPEIKIDFSPSAQRLVSQVNISEKEEIPADNLYCEFIGPASEGRVALRDIGERPIESYSIDEIEPEHSQCEHKQPCHLFRRTIIDVVHTTEPRHGLIVREYPVPTKGFFETPNYVTDPADKRTFDLEEWECQDTPTALNYTQATKYSDIQPSDSILLDKQSSRTPNDFKEETLTVSHALPDKQEGIVNSKELPKEEEPREPTRAAVEMAHTFIQAQPCAEPMHTKDHEGKAASPFTVDDSLPEINLNDTSVSLTELLRRVRERNRILYCREVSLQLAKNMAALNPEGKCGDKKPPCPPPQPKCPPPPPPCPPPPPPKCPPPCPPPKSKCPQPKCPPPCPPPPKCAPCPPKKDPCGKKDPCAKYKAHETITLVLHLGPLVNPAKKLILPVLATNFIPAAAPSSEELPVKGYLAKLINQKLGLFREILRYILEGHPNHLTCDMILLRLNRTRDYTPWSPIPSWPYPIINKKRPLQCPKEGCPVDPPVNPAPKFQRPCPNKPCLEFPKPPGS
ncbi:hypothetical protein MSG28_014722 [Choristoneura fumiferana]|uniref:Uncharacterized protein n=1 Tax=Choristoneura fumiferana TaxID=7141 RepID=A0ACC0JSF5_CHOFU|nr:hypothetical protein MSG28_014722 [Choristoneura fumiferana]